MNGRIVEMYCPKHGKRLFDSFTMSQMVVAPMCGASDPERLLGVCDRKVGPSTEGDQ